MQYFIYINYTQNNFFYSHTTNEWFASCIDNFYSRFIKRYNTVAQKCPSPFTFIVCQNLLEKTKINNFKITNR